MFFCNVPCIMPSIVNVAPMDVLGATTCRLGMHGSQFPLSFSSASLSKSSCFSNARTDVWTISWHSRRGTFISFVSCFSLLAVADAWQLYNDESRLGYRAAFLSLQVNRLPCAFDGKRPGWRIRLIWKSNIHVCFNFVSVAAIPIDFYSRSLLRCFKTLLDCFFLMFRQVGWELNIERQDKVASSTWIARQWHAFIQHNLFCLVSTIYKICSGFRQSLLCWWWK